MANPRSRHSRSRQAKRRANWKGKLPNLILCSDCKEMRLSHRVCPNCGSYDGKKILEPASK